MSKPTLVQTLLNRPSQTYGSHHHSSERTKEYHSAKKEMLRIAAAQSDRSLSEYFTPDTSPRTSMATIRKPSRRSLRDSTPTPTPTTTATTTTAVPSTRTPTGSSSHRAIYTLSTGSSLSSTSLDGHSIFSDYMTAAGSIDENYDDKNNRDERVKSPSTTTTTTTTTVVVPASSYGVKSTVTPNNNSRSGQKILSSGVKHLDIKPPLSGSGQKYRPSTKDPPPPPPPRQPNGNPHRPFNAFAPLPTPVKQSTSTTPSSSSSKRPQQPNGAPIKPTQKPIPKPPSASNNNSTAESHHPDLPPKPPSSQTMSSYQNRRHNNSSKMQNSIMMNMSALLEEDEDGGDHEGKRPALRHTSERGRERKRSHAPGSILAASSSSSDSGSVTQGVINHAKNPPLQRRRSRSLDSVSSATRLGPPPQTLSAEVQALTLASHGDLPSIGTQGYTSLVLPRAPVPLSDRPVTTGGGGGGLFGHFSFGLPWNKLADGKVDLTRSGIAQTTMASVEVVRGLSSRGGAMFGRRGSWKVLGVLGRRPSTNSSSSLSSTKVAGGSSDEGVVKPKAATTTTTILGFTSYRAPPSYVPSQSVLVQVWAVGVDGVDGRLVGVRFGSTVSKGQNEGSQVEDGDEQDVGDDEGVGEVEDHDRRDNPVTNSTASQNSATKNPFTALGRSLSLSLKRPRKSSMDEQKPQLGRSFSLKPNKKHDPNSVSISTPGSMTNGPVTHTKHNATTVPSKPGSATPTPEKKRSATQLQHQRSKHQEFHTSSPLGTPPKLPSKPQRLKAKTKAAPLPGLQIHMETQTQVHSSPVTASKQVAGTPAVKDRQSMGPAAASASDKNNQSSSSPSTKAKSSPQPKSKPRLVPRMPSQPPVPKPAEVGFIPGRSFVGRVLEVGWELGDEVVRKGEWVVGLFDVRKCGALAEFIVVDRHRIHRVPHPSKAVPTDNPNATPNPVWGGSTLTSSPQSNPIMLGEEEPKRKRDNSSRDGRIDADGDGNAKRAKKSTRMPTQPPPVSILTLEEMALLPLCGIPAYRAVRSFIYAFSGDGKSLTSEHPQLHRRRALVLRGHDGAGAMAVQMLIRRGWRVSVHVPFSCVPVDATQELADGFMHAVEDRAREWGADEVIFDDGEAEDGDDGRAAAVRVVETLREEGDVFDAILDTVGGKEVREAGERLLKSNATLPAADGSVAVMSPGGGKSKRRGVGLFTTLVGDTPERPIPSAADAFRANLRSFRFGGAEGNSGGGGGRANNGVGGGSIDVDSGGGGGGGGIQGMVGYAWVSVAHEVSEWEGADVRETLGAVLRLAMETGGIRPVVEDVGGGILGRPRVVAFEKAPGVFVDNGPLGDGGTLVVRIAG